MAIADMSRSLMTSYSASSSRISREVETSLFGGAHADTVTSPGKVKSSAICSGPDGAAPYLWLGLREASTLWAPRLKRGPVLPAGLHRRLRFDSGFENGLGGPIASSLPRSDFDDHETGGSNARGRAACCGCG